MQRSLKCSHCWRHCLKSSTEMLSRAASDSHCISAMLAKRLHFKTCFIRGYKKIVIRSEVRSVGVVGHHHQFVFSQKLLDAQGCVCGGIVMVQETNPHSATFLDNFITGSHTIFSTHSNKISDLLRVLEKQTPCALSHQYQKKKSTLS